LSEGKPTAFLPPFRVDESMMFLVIAGKTMISYVTEISRCLASDVTMRMLELLLHD
jgi:hypothetical protein